MSLSITVETLDWLEHEIKMAERNAENAFNRSDHTAVINIQKKLKKIRFCYDAIVAWEVGKHENRNF